MADVTRILSAIEGDDQKATDELRPSVYEELLLAAQKRSHEKSGQMLQATALGMRPIFRPFSGRPSDSSRKDPWEPLRKVEKNDPIKMTLANLPRKHHDVLARAYLTQLKYKQIADIVAL